MKTKMSKEVAVSFVKSIEGIIVKSSWNYYDSRRDNSKAVHFAVFFDHEGYSVRKTIFAFGSRAKRNTFVNQMLSFGEVDADLVDYSHHSTTAIKQAEARCICGLKSESSHSHSVLSAVAEEPGYDVSVIFGTIAEEGVRKQLSDELDAYMFKGMQRGNPLYFWEPLNLANPTTVSKALSSVQGEWEKFPYAPADIKPFSSESENFQVLVGLLVTAASKLRAAGVDACACDCGALQFSVVTNEIQEDGSIVDHRYCLACDFFIDLKSFN